MKEAADVFAYNNVWVIQQNKKEFLQMKATFTPAQNQ
jgi:hypothetical protein